MVTQDLNLEFKNAANAKYINSIANESAMLQRVHSKIRNVNVLRQSETYRLIEKAVETIMRKNGIEIYNLQPTSLHKAANSDRYEATVVISYIDNGCLGKYLIDLSPDHV